MFICAVMPVPQGTRRATEHEHLPRPPQSNRARALAPPSSNFASYARLPAEEGVDIAIIEVGLGGRLDATNVIPVPVATGIATLDFDHVDVLGGSILSIAREKAGIIKRGNPAIASHQSIRGAEKQLLECSEKASVNLQWAETSALCSLGVRAQDQDQHKGMSQAAKPELDSAAGCVIGLAGRF